MAELTRTAEGCIQHAPGLGVGPALQAMGQSLPSKLPEGLLSGGAQDSSGEASTLLGRVMPSLVAGSQAWGARRVQARAGEAEGGETVPAGVLLRAYLLELHGSDTSGALVGLPAGAQGSPWWEEAVSPEALAECLLRFKMSYGKARLDFFLAYLEAHPGAYPGARA